jgi:S1-C subfamily serine protease
MIRVLVLFAISMLAAPAVYAAGKQEALPWLGMGFTWQSASEQRFLHVRKVTPDGPASRAGVLPGDIITTINGQRVDIGDELDLLLFLAERKPGDRLKMAVTRAGERRNLVVVVGTAPEASRDAWTRNLRTARERRRQRSGQGD